MHFSARLFCFVFVFLALTLFSFSKAVPIHAGLFGAFETSATDCDKKIGDDWQETQTNPSGPTKLYDCKSGYKEVSNALQAFNWQILGSTDQRLYEAGEKGAVFAFAQLNDSMIDTPPASGLAYTGYVLANIGIFPKAYAQGIGFVGLLPLFPLWAAFRNIAYSILIIVMVVIGFMVIFRMKIDPKTVISIQAAIPKIIVALLLITFSYPIAGFLIDLMYLAMAIAINIIATSLPEATFPDYMRDSADLQNLFITGGWGALWGSVFNFRLIGDFFKQIFLGSSLNTGVGITTELLSAIISVGFGGVAGAAAIPWAIGGLIAPVAILLLIIGLGLLFTVIRITFLLLNAYIQIILALIFSPILLLQEAIPGRSAFGQWIQNLIANLIVFPATVLVIYGSWILTTFAWKSNLWSPPLTPVGGGGDLGGSGNPIAVLLGLGMIFMTPNLIASIKKAFHPTSPLPISAGSAFSPLTGGISTGMGAMSQFYYMQQLWGAHGQPGPLQALVGKVAPFLRGGRGDHNNPS
ncbi:hypothetical protein HYW55_05895 [Candidatus Gottesmanbacteria bacterium]|nr:hypothetical protein [Candidatus Gottesmanbacteria bacterium]